jgi:hypothetical protein
MQIAPKEDTRGNLNNPGRSPASRAAGEPTIEAQSNLNRARGELSAASQDPGC